MLQLFPIYHTITLALGTNHELLLDYHHRFGPIFRTGWNTVICVDARAAVDILNYEKAPNYSIFSYFGENMFSTQDQRFHSARSRLVSPSLRKPSVDLMEPAVLNYISQMLGLLGTHAAENVPVDLFLLLHNLTYDIMGQLVFGQPFGMLKYGSHPIVGWMIKGLAITLLSLIVPALKLFPNVYNEKVREAIYACNHSHVPPPIISNYINSVDHLTGESMTIDQVVAEIRARVEDELSGFTSEISFKMCQERLPYLQAVIKESMRLLPAVSGVGLRKIPASGRTLLGHHLPEGWESPATQFTALPTYGPIRINSYRNVG
ncbi:hypothetical protein L0F63_001952 [Massospora cicadina]|nr:hypothetical protein L0F63_001952 [Massospora cicadina]